VTAIIAYVRSRQIPGELDVCGGDGQLTPFGMALPGVDGEVHDDLFDLARVGLASHRSGASGGGQRDVRADEPPEIVSRLRTTRQVEDLGLKHLLAAERQDWRVRFAPRSPALTISSTWLRLSVVLDVL